MITKKINLKQKAFSLTEILVVMMISATVLIAAIAIYTHSEKSAAALAAKLDEFELPREILQRIAEDIDSLATAGLDTSVTIENQLTDGYQTAKLTISNQFYNNAGQKKTFEEVIWQANYDRDYDSLILYRSHGGLAPEDQLLETDLQEFQRQAFVPIAAGLTYFKIQAMQGDQTQDKWTSTELPKAIVAQLSFAEPFKAPTGGLEVFDEDKIVRTIAVNRARKISYKFVEKEFDFMDVNDVNDFEDANDFDEDIEDVNDANEIEEK